MNSQTRKAVLKVLQEASCRGLAQSSGRWSIGTGLTKWQRFVNWLARKIGADQSPFIDPYNYGKIEILPMRHIVDESLINQAMKEFAGKPYCRICGSENLLPDPAGYYCHAEDYNGAPLLCMDHSEKIDKKDPMYGKR